jgi:hypothetical protein
MSISYNNGVVIKLVSKPIFEYNDSLLNDNDYGMGNPNYTPHFLINKIISDSNLVPRSYALYVVNPNPNLGI